MYTRIHACMYVYARTSVRIDHHATYACMLTRMHALLVVMHYREFQSVAITMHRQHRQYSHCMRAVCIGPTLLASSCTTITAISIPSVITADSQDSGIRDNSTGVYILLRVYDIQCGQQLEVLYSSAASSLSSSPARW